MEYHRDEADRFFPERRPKDHPPVWFLAALLIGWFGAMLFAASTGFEDAANIAQDEEEAHEKKVALNSIPCSTWVCQKHFSHEPCGRASNTACAASADFTERK